MKRIGQVIGIDPTRIREYADYNDNIWPEISSALAAAEIRNYVVFHHGDVLFGDYEYHGPDDEYEARIAAVGEVPRMKEWWAVVGGMQRPLPDRSPGEFWKTLDCVFDATQSRVGLASASSSTVKYETSARAVWPGGGA